MDKELLVIIGFAALTFLFVLPRWTPVEPSLEIDSVLVDADAVTFSLSYQAPERKSCFLVFYGPFRYDAIGHEAGNNIHVLTEQVGTLTDTLAVRMGDTLESFDVEMWCDNEKIAESVMPL